MLLLFGIILLAIGTVYVVGDCGQPPVISDAKHNWSGSTLIPDGTEITYQCDNIVYEPKPLADPTYVCSGDTWTSGDFECEQITCGYIDPPMHGQVANLVTYVAGSQMKFECHDGYSLSGITTLTCLINGHWNGVAPSCNIVTCQEFPSITHAYTKLIQSINGIKEEHGSVVRVSCSDGFIIDGSPDVQCQANGQWTTVPTCVSINCDPHPGLNSSCISEVAWMADINLLFLICKTEHTTGTGPMDEGVSCIASGWSDESLACYCDCHVDANTGLVTLHNADSSGYIKHGQQLSWLCKNGGIKITVGAIVCNDGKVTVPECQPKPPPATPTTQKLPPTTTEACHNCVHVKSKPTQVQGKEIICIVNTTSVGTYTINWKKDSEVISTYDSIDFVLLDKVLGYNSSFVSAGKILTVSMLFPSTKSFFGKYTCQLQADDGTVLSQDSYQFNNGKKIPEKSQDGLIVALIIAGAAVVMIVIAAVWKGKVAVKYLLEKVGRSDNTSGAEAKFKPGNNKADGANGDGDAPEKKPMLAADGAEVTVTTGD